MQFGRRANGPQVYRTPARRAADIAASILSHQREGQQRDIEKDYGVKDAILKGLIEQELMKHAA